MAFPVPAGKWYSHIYRMMKVTLFQLKNENISVTIEAFYDQSGCLVVEGYDIGKTVKEYWGDSDYEYSVKVAPDELKKLYPLLGIAQNEKQEMLSYLKTHFHTNTCYSEVREFLEHHGIKHEGFSWT
jgi:hypothetical protein